MQAIAVQADAGQDKLLLATGWDEQTCGDEGCVWESGYTLLRLDAQGRLDASFGDEGRVTRSLTGPGSCFVVDVAEVAVAPDGDPVLAYSESGFEDDNCMFPGAPPVRARITRLDAQAGYGVDPAFGDHDLRLGWRMFTHDLDLTPAGKLLLGGEATDGAMSTGSWAWVARRDATTGAADPGFGVGGAERLPFEAQHARAKGVEQAPDGSVLAASDLSDVVCWPCVSTAPGLGVARLTSRGELDETFGRGGTRVVDFGTPTHFTGALGLSGDRVVVAGGAGEKLAAARLLLGAGSPPPVTPPVLTPGGPQVPGPPNPAPLPGSLLLRGTSGADLLRGGPLGDVLCGLAGADRVIGAGGDDRLHGDACSDATRRGDGADRLEGGDGDDRLAGAGGDDRLDGGPGKDSLLGGPGKDNLLGGTEEDSLLGGAGKDHLVGGAGTDRLRGGAGADVIDAADGRRDVIACGAGRDRTRVDAADRVRGCERVRRR